MSTITFDTHEFVGKLRAAGFDERQAETVVRVVTEAQSGFVTREHFDSRITLLEAKVDARFALIDAKFDKLNWMIGFNLAATMVIMWKVFS